MAAIANAAALGGFVGGVLALTGAGGAILAVPLLVFGLGLSMAQAGPVALLAVAVSALVGAALGWRQGLLRYRAAALMAVAGVLVTPAGLWLAQRIPNQPLTALFAIVLAGVSIRMWRQASGQLQGKAGAATDAASCRVDESSGRLRWNQPCAWRLVAAGAGAGFLSGLLGVGGGFVIVPALLAVSNLPMRAVTATSMGVLAVVSAGAVLQSALGGRLALDLALPFAAGAMAGLLLARGAASRLAGPRLQQVFALVSLVIAAGLFIRALS